jgi:Sulfotransferase family
LFDTTAFLFHRTRYTLNAARANVVNWRDRLIDPQAAAFFETMAECGYNPNAHIDVLPRHGLLYISVPKCASTTIKGALSVLDHGVAPPPERLHARRYSGLYSPLRVGLSNFRQLALSPSTLRFSFVRNPYARLVSAWADKFQDKPLVPGNSFIDAYLELRPTIDRGLPNGRGHTLSFPQFVTFAVATADCRLDAHWQMQDDLVSMPGINVNFVGKVEAFPQDFKRVLDHVRADESVRAAISARHNASRHEPWRDYYNDDLAKQVYRAYQRDFDRFGYSRSVAA